MVKKKHPVKFLLRKSIKAGLFALCLLLSCGIVQAAQTPSEDFARANRALRGAEQDFQQAEKDFQQAEKTAPGQTTSSVPYTNMNPQNTSTGASASTANQPSQNGPVLYGSPETGYAGTWTDPKNGDIITSVIAPTPPANQNNQQYPVIIEPSVGNWNNSGGSGVIWGGNTPQWPTTPDNPGWGGFPGNPPPPPPSPSFPPAPGSYPGQNFYPSPPLPPNFHPGYRPLYPPAPGHWQRPPGGNPPGIIPGVTPLPGQKPPTWHPNGFIPGVTPPPNFNNSSGHFGPGNNTRPNPPGFMPNRPGFPGPGGPVIPPSWQRSPSPQRGPAGGPGFPGRGNF